MLTKTTKKAFYSKVFTRLMNGQPISSRFCNHHGFDIKDVYKLLKEQTKIYVRFISHNKGDYIFNWYENYDMRHMLIDDYLSREMPKHELKRNEVKI